MPTPRNQNATERALGLYIWPNIYPSCDLSRLEKAIFLVAWRWYSSSAHRSYWSRPFSPGATAMAVRRDIRRSGRFTDHSRSRSGESRRRSHRASCCSEKGWARLGLLALFKSISISYRAKDAQRIWRSTCAARGLDSDGQARHSARVCKRVHARLRAGPGDATPWAGAVEEIDLSGRRPHVEVPRQGQTAPPHAGTQDVDIVVDLRILADTEAYHSSRITSASSASSAREMTRARSSRGAGRPARSMAH